MDSEVKLPEKGFRGSLNIVRDTLQDEFHMLQLWGGKTANGEDFMLYVSRGLTGYAVISSEAEDGDMFTVTIVGKISFMHQKNIKKIVESL
jgi:hypothetical protein